MKRVSRVLLAVLLVASTYATIGAQFQEGPPSKPIAAKAQLRPARTVKVEVPIAEPVRTDTPAFRGENWFLQKCSMCHFGDWGKAGQAQPLLSLAGVLRDASPEREAAVREQIRRGSLNMPSFQHTFTPREVDDLIAYLKTL